MYFHTNRKGQMATLMLYARCKETTILNLNKHHSLFIALAAVAAVVVVAVAVAEMRWKAINCEALTLFFLFQ